MPKLALALSLGLLLPGCRTATAEPPDAAVDPVEEARRELTTGRPERVLRVLPDLLKTHPHDADVHDLAVSAYEASGREHDLHGELERWIEQHPGSAAAWQRLGEHLLDPSGPHGPRDVDAAIRALTRAVELSDAPDATLLMSLGTARYLDSDLDGALDAYRAALRACDAGHADAEALECRQELTRLIEEIRAERDGADGN